MSSGTESDPKSLLPVQSEEACSYLTGTAYSLRMSFPSPGLDKLSRIDLGKYSLASALRPEGVQVAGGRKTCAWDSSLR